MKNLSTLISIQKLIARTLLALVCLGYVLYSLFYDQAITAHEMQWFWICLLILFTIDSDEIREDWREWLKKDD